MHLNGKSRRDIARELFPDSDTESVTHTTPNSDAV